MIKYDIQCASFNEYTRIYDELIKFGKIENEYIDI